MDAWELPGSAGRASSGGRADRRHRTTLTPGCAPSRSNRRGRSGGWCAGVLWRRRCAPRLRGRARWRPGRTRSQWGTPPGVRRGSARRRGRPWRYRAAPPSLRRLVFVVAGDFAGLAPYQVGVDQRVEIAFQDAVHVADGKPAAQILHQAVGGQDVVADLAAEVDFEFGILGLAGLHALLCQFELVEPGTQLLHRRSPVRVLPPVGRALHHDAAWEMRHPHGGIGHVDMLSAGAAGPECIDAQVLFLDIDLDFVVHLREDEDAGEGGVTARVGVEGRDAHQAVDADFGLQQAVGVLAVDLEGGALDARTFAFQAVGHDGGEALALGPPQVHAEQHLGPILALRAAGAGVYGDDGGTRVVFAGQEHGRFQALQVLGVGLEIALDIADDGFAFAGEFEQGVEIVRHAVDAAIVGDSLFQAFAGLHHLLALVGLIPEVGRGNLLFGLG